MVHSPGTSNSGALVAFDQRVDWQTVTFGFLSLAGFGGESRGFGSERDTEWGGSLKRRGSLSGCFRLQEGPQYSNAGGYVFL